MFLQNSSNPTEKKEHLTTANNGMRRGLIYIFNTRTVILYWKRKTKIISKNDGKAPTIHCCLTVIIRKYIYFVYDVDDVNQERKKQNNRSAPKANETDIE